jgi:hypothetical protein
VLALAKSDDADAKAEAIRNADPDGVPDPDSATTTRFFKPRKVLSSGTVTVGGHAIAYTAEAGALVVHQSRLGRYRHGAKRPPRARPRTM